MPNIDKPVPELARELRAEMVRQGLTQTALAERIGRKQGWISRKLSGARRITVTDLQLIARGLSKDPAQLLQSVGRDA